MEGIELRQIQMLQLEIAKEIKRICDEYKIRYFLVGGTLLGAVRHTGFIPWDDDMDIGMSQKDYLRFIKCCKSHLGNRFMLQTWEEDLSYGYPFAKIRMKATEMQEMIAPSNCIHRGIWVDVFPYIPTDREFLTKKKLMRLNVMAKLYLIKCGYSIQKITSDLKSRVLNSVLKIISVFFDSQKLKEKYICMINSLAKEDGDMWLECDGRFTGMFSFEKGIFDEFQGLQFEDTVFCVPGKYKKYLEKAYGNYLELPPESERLIGHYVINCHLEKAYETYFASE